MTRNVCRTPHQSVELGKSNSEVPVGERRGQAAKRVYLSKICGEQLIDKNAEGGLKDEALICWYYGRPWATSPSHHPLLGYSPAKAGNDAQLPCDFTYAGKFRHGAEQLWCRTHPTHWGTKADIKELELHGEMRCANYQQAMNYVVSPIDGEHHTACRSRDLLRDACRALDSPIAPRALKIQVPVRDNVTGKKAIDRDLIAILTRYNNGLGLFHDQEIARVNITPPAAYDFCRAMEANQEMSCISCSTCGYPHLDLADFADTPHRKHFCGNCGRYSTGARSRLFDSAKASA